MKHHALRSPASAIERTLPRRGPIGVAPRIDAVDRAIIEALQEDGRRSFRRIAVEIGVSEATVRARYARLREANILQVTAVTNPLGLGFDGMAMIGIRTATAPEQVADAIARWAEADYVVVTAGQYDILVEVVCPTRAALLEVSNRIRSLDGVVSTETFVYLGLCKQLYDWGADAGVHRVEEDR